MTNEIAIVLAAAIGVLGALGGSFVAPAFQRAHEKWRAEREDHQLLREKATELFDELDRIIRQSNQANISALASLSQDQPEIAPVPDLGRVRMLVSVYFSDLAALVQAYDDAVSQETAKLADEIARF